MNQKIACVTGASGKIGKRIVDTLLSRNFHVRVLCFSKPNLTLGIECFTGGLHDKDVLQNFLKDATYLFHCAAELHNEKNMHAVNVVGTERLFEVVQESNLSYFCHMSSAGVIGTTKLKWVDEAASCHPDNEYERTKHQAELVVNKKIKNCSTVILRPINVMDDDFSGVFDLPIRNTLKDRLHVFIKGNECAHQVHAGYIAKSAIHFMDKAFSKPEVFFVGNDEEEANTYKGIWNLVSQNSQSSTKSIKYSLPIWFPYLLRRLRGIKGNIANVRYSSKKLLNSGCENEWNLKKTTDMLLQKSSEKSSSNL